jgi:hypothetical protein
MNKENATLATKNNMPEQKPAEGSTPEQEASDPI